MLFRSGDMALSRAEQFLACYPQDPTATRTTLANLYLAANQPQQAIQLQQRYPSLKHPSVPMAALWGHLQQGNNGKALLILADLQKHNKENIKVLSRAVNMSQSDFDRRYLSTDNDMADYWEEQGDHWRKHPETLAWLKRNLPRV